MVVFFSMLKGIWRCAYSEGTSPPSPRKMQLFVSSKTGLPNDWRNLERLNIWVVVHSQHWEIRDVQLIQSFSMDGQTINYSGTYLGQMFNKAGIYMVHSLDLPLKYIWEFYEKCLVPTACPVSRRDQQNYLRIERKKNYFFLFQD